MNTKTDLFDIYFSGKLMPDANIIYARSKIGAMFKANEEQLEKLFSDEPTMLKHAVNMDKAIKYRLAFRKAGALIDIKPAAKSSQEQLKPTSVAPKKAVAMDESAVEEVEEIVITAVAAPMPEDTVVENSQSVSETDPAEAIAALSLDHLSLAPVGTDIAEKVVVEAREFNTENLEVLPPNQGTLKYFSIEKKPVKIPDISHLSAEKPNIFE